MWWSWDVYNDGERDDIKYQIWGRSMKFIIIIIIIDIIMGTTVTTSDGQVRQKRVWLISWG